METAQPAGTMEDLQREIRRLKHRIDTLEQEVEALGDDNRYFAGQVLGHCPTEKEAVEFYCDPENEGAKGHRERVRVRAEAAKPPTTKAA